MWFNEKSSFWLKIHWRTNMNKAPEKFSFWFRERNQLSWLLFLPVRATGGKSKIWRFEPLSTQNFMKGRRKSGQKYLSLLWKDNAKIRNSILSLYFHIICLIQPNNIATMWLGRYRGPRLIHSGNVATGYYLPLFFGIILRPKDIPCSMASKSEYKQLRQNNNNDSSCWCSG